ncbi:MAG: polyphosphate kinase [Bradymonadia bacterium]|jgi:polyphosphate kinase
MAIEGARKSKQPFDDPALFVNREFSWLRYNGRVLSGATRSKTPLLERLRFLTYFASNLDEFVMIRVANLLEADEAGLDKRGPDNLTPAEQLEQLSVQTHELMNLACETLQKDILPGLEKEGLFIVPVHDLTPTNLERVRTHFHECVFPVLTPKTVDPSHPFPNLPNLSHNIVVCFDDAEEHDKQEFAIVEIPSVLEQLIKVEPTRKGGRNEYVLLADVIHHFANELFQGLPVRGTWQFRLTRDADLDLREPELENLLSDVERELTARTFRRVVRLEVEDSIAADLLAQLVASIGIDEREVYRLPVPFNLGSLRGLYGVRGYGHLKDPPFNPRLSPRMAEHNSIFSIIREKDILLHHPYESFSTVAELLREAAVDKDVLAIKLTLYRTSGDSVIIEALKRAAEENKSVTALVELKARFDETNNIRWARELEAAGVHVVYGIVGLKTHCKAALIVRRERNKTRRYVHLSTGNYNSITAKVYTDLALMTADPKMGEDVSQLFNILTGYSARNIHSILDGRIPRPKFHHLFVAPFELVGRFLELIEDEVKHHEKTGKGLIQAKVNALQEPSIIRALYAASCAGVKIRLIVRGICSLKPGIPGVSENIEVTSIVDRFLEHPRIYHFRHGGADLVYLSSADWMPRNLFRRVEQMFPIMDPDLKARILGEIIPLGFEDTASSWKMLQDGSYEKREPPAGEEPMRSQSRFIELAREAGQKSIPYERALRETRTAAGKKRRKSKKS